MERLRGRKTKRRSFWKLTKGSWPCFKRMRGSKGGWSASGFIYIRPDNCLTSPQEPQSSGLEIPKEGPSFLTPAPWLFFLSLLSLFFPLLFFFFTLVFSPALSLLLSCACQSSISHHESVCLGVLTILWEADTCLALPSSPKGVFSPSRSPSLSLFFFFLTWIYFPPHTFSTSLKSWQQVRARGQDKHEGKGQEGKMRGGESSSDGEGKS